MRQAHIIKGAAAAVVLLVIITGLSALANVKAVHRLEAASINREQSLAAARAVAASSALLTNTVRAYTSTGSPQWLEMYWNEILVTQAQPKAIAKLVKLGTPMSELDLIAEAKGLSAALVDTETRAQRLVLEAQGVAPAEMPEAVAGYQLAAEDLALGAAKKMKLAVELTHNQAYQDEVAKIMAPISKFNELLDKRVNEAVADSTKSESRSMNLLLGSVFLLALTFGFVLYLVATKLGRPIQAYTTALRNRDEHDLSFRLTPDGVVETQELATAFNGQTEQVSNVIGAIRQNAESLTSASDALSATAHGMMSSSEQTSSESTVAHGEAERVSNSLGSVAAGTEEMSASIREISDSAVNASTVASEAVRAAESTSSTVDKLSESSQRIGEVMKSINSIAEQTNLLALNATIEAARAGEAGKGFAVVASEVKDLARQTAVATEDISNRVASIQADATATATALDEITEIIARINESQATIASAVEEQTATTNEMSRTISIAADGAAGIASNTERVHHAAAATSDGVHSTIQAAEEMATTARSLHDLVSDYHS